LGTAIRSSNRFGGCGTFADSRVQVCSTGSTEAGTVFPAEQQPGGHGQRQLLPGYISYVDMRSTLEQRVRIGIVGRVRIRAEDGRIHVDAQNRPDISEASPAVRLQGPAKRPTPQVLAWAGSLELTRDRYGAHEVKIQTFERRIVRLQLTNSLDGPPLQVPYVHSEHSRLN
jgi:hypothetical protein